LARKASGIFEKEYRGGAMMGVSLRAYARMRGCSLTAVQKAIASKRITPLPDGTIDPERANKEWAKNTFAGQTVHEAPVAPPPERLPPLHESPAPTGDPVTAYLRARAVKTSFEARSAQLEYEERASKLIPAVRASEYAATFSAIVEDSLMAMPDRLALNSCHLRWTNPLRDRQAEREHAFRELQNHRLRRPPERSRSTATRPAS
jgi:hypothetical protein